MQSRIFAVAAVADGEHLRNSSQLECQSKFDQNAVVFQRKDSRRTRNSGLLRCWSIPTNIEASGWCLLLQSGVCSHFGRFCVGPWCNLLNKILLNFAFLTPKQSCKSCYYWCLRFCNVCNILLRHQRNAPRKSETLSFLKILPNFFPQQQKAPEVSNAATGSPRLLSRFRAEAGRHIFHVGRHSQDRRHETVRLRNKTWVWSQRQRPLMPEFVFDLSSINLSQLAAKFGSRNFAGRSTTPWQGEHGFINWQGW